jgi:hypothetical protein
VHRLAHSLILVQARIRLTSYLLPVLTGLALLMQIVDPYRGWMILLVGLGGAGW